MAPTPKFIPARSTSSLPARQPLAGLLLLLSLPLLLTPALNPSACAGAVSPRRLRAGTETEVVRPRQSPLRLHRMSASRLSAGPHGDPSPANRAGSTSTSTSTRSAALRGSMGRSIHRILGGSNLVAWPGLGGGLAGPLQDQGGPVLSKPITVHVIFYGHWGDNSRGQRVLTGFIESLSDSSADAVGASLHQWWEVLTQYSDNTGSTISAEVKLGKVLYASGKAHLNDGFQGGNNDVASIVEQQIRSGQLPLDSAAYYVVLTSKEITVGSTSSGFCGVQSGYCGWHTQSQVGSSSIQIGFVGDGTQQCPQGCGFNEGLSDTPNGAFSIDSLISPFAHELAEMASDPDTQSGYIATDQNGHGFETGDLCEGQYTDNAVPALLSNSAQTFVYNLVGIQGLKFLVQTMVDVETQECVLRRRDSNASAPSPSGGGNFFPPASEVPGAAPTALPPSLLPSFSPSGVNVPVTSPPPTIAPSPSVSGPTPATEASPPAVAFAPSPDNSGNSTSGGVVDPGCVNNDYSDCNTCNDPEGCVCFQGECFSICKVADYLSGDDF